MKAYYDVYLHYRFISGAEGSTLVIDQTETNLVALRRTIYLTVQSSLDFEECAHKLLKMDLKPGQEVRYQCVRTGLDVMFYLRPKKINCLFPVTVRKKNRVGRSVKKIFCIIFLVKNVCFMHVLR